MPASVVLHDRQERLTTAEHHSAFGAGFANTPREWIDCFRSRSQRMQRLVNGRAWPGKCLGRIERPEIVPKVPVV